MLVWHFREPAKWNEQPGVSSLESSHTQLRCNVFVQWNVAICMITRPGIKIKLSVKYLWVQLVAPKSDSGFFFLKWIVTCPICCVQGTNYCWFWIQKQFPWYKTASSSCYQTNRQQIEVYHGIQMYTTHLTHRLISVAPPSAHPRSMRPLPFQQSPGMPFDYALPGNSSHSNKAARWSINCRSD